MRTLLLGFLALLLAPPSRAAAAPQSDAPQRLRYEAAAFLRRGDFATARQKLASAQPAAGRATVNAIDLGQQWTLLAYYFRRSGESSLARQAAAEAVALARTLPASLGSNSERSSFFASVGLLSERILHDLPQAKSLYDASVTAQPGNREARKRQQAANARINQRARPSPGNP